MPTPRLDLRSIFTRVSDRPLLDCSAVRWSGHATIMFPTVVNMNEHLKHPLDHFYLYYASHGGRGIGLATAPHPEGPWTPYADNPVFTLEQVPGFRVHISSPELIFLPEHRRFHLYFHGPTYQGSQHTGMAISEDGLHFTPVSTGPILLGASLTESAPKGWNDPHAAYLRVFRRDGWFYGVFKGAIANGLVRSEDGLHWEHGPHNPLIEISEEHREFDRIRHVALMIREPMLYILYSTYTDPERSREAIKLASVPMHGTWEDWGPLKRWGEVFAPSLPWEENNVRDPYLLRHNGTVYLYYVGGHEKGIALAKMDYPRLTSILDEFSEDDMADSL